MLLSLYTVYNIPLKRQHKTLIFQIMASFDPSSKIHQKQSWFGALHKLWNTVQPSDRDAFVAEVNNLHSQHDASRYVCRLCLNEKKDKTFYSVMNAQEHARDVHGIKDFVTFPGHEQILERQKEIRKKRKEKRKRTDEEEEEEEPQEITLPYVEPAAYSTDLPICEEYRAYRSQQAAATTTRYMYILSFSLLTQYTPVMRSTR